MNTETCHRCDGNGFITWGHDFTCPRCGGSGSLLAFPETIRYCATCGEREGSGYAKHCCTSDQMIEETTTTKETLS